MTDGDNSITVDWNNAAEVSVATILGMVPEVGLLLSALTYIFWPHPNVDVWAEVRAQVEELVQEKLDDLIYNDAKQDLDGLHSEFVNDYLPSLSEGNNSDINTYWDQATGDCDMYLQKFQMPGFPVQLQLLPLFAQFANLHLSLLRDGVLFGPQWGWTQKKLEDKTNYLTQKISDYTQYAQNVYNFYYENRVILTQPNAHECQPFRDVNAFVRQMTLTVLDFVNMWPYFDATKYPGPVNVYLDREIYSDPIGTCDDSGPITLPGPPKDFPTGLTVWGDQFRVYAIQVTYPTGGGPGGVTQTARMGSPDKGGTQPPHGGNVNLETEGVVVVLGTSGSIIDSLGFTLDDGTGAGPFGGTQSGSPYTFIYPGHRLSSIHVNGVSQYYDSADSAVFGFKYDQTTQADTEALRRLYVAAPTPRTTDELAARCRVKTADAGDLASKAAAENWDAQRQGYWTSLRNQSAK